MEIVLIILLVLLLGAVAYLIWQNWRQAQQPEKKDDTGLKLILEQQHHLRDTLDGQLENFRNAFDNKISRLNDTVDKKLGENTEKTFSTLQQHSNRVQDEISKQSEQSFKTIREITEKLEQLGSTNEKVLSTTQQLQELQNILKNPKQRGVLGEYYLETLLKNVLGVGQFEMQYKFKNGEIADAAVFVKDKIIPVDSKFSLENYNRLVEAERVGDDVARASFEKVFVNDLKERIKETAKYIRPEENTTDFAFMFIPHEAIYYDLLINKIGAVGEDTENIIQRAVGTYKVIVVSPTSFLAYLQTVMQGLRAMQIEEQAKDIGKRVGELGKHLLKYNEFHSKLGASLTTSVNHYNAAGKEFLKIDKDVLRITGEKMGLETETVARTED